MLETKQQWSPLTSIVGTKNTETMTWGWINDSNFILGWTMPLILRVSKRTENAHEKINDIFSVRNFDIISRPQVQIR